MKRQGSIVVVLMAMFMATSVFAGTQTEAAELARFEEDVAQLRGHQSAPATSDNQGMRLNAGSPATLRDGQGVCGAQIKEKSAELAQFEEDVAQLRGPQSAPATPANQGMCLYVGSPAMLLDDRVAAGGISPQATSFVVWLQNQTSDYLTTRLWWRDVYSSYIHQTQAGVSPGQVAPHITSACGTVVAYIVDVYKGGYFVASTGATQPIADDGYPCSDAWGIAPQ